MFRRRKQWHPNGDFPTASVQRLPFQRISSESLANNNNNKIFYSTRYEPHNSDKCGIFSYDVTDGSNTAIVLWKDIDYYPRWDVTTYNETDDTIIFVGGANVKNHHHRYQLLVIYNLRENSLQKIKIPIIIGGNARIILSSNDNYLHIIGGTSNDKHILYDLRPNTKLKNKIKLMYSFYDSYPQIQSCGLLYSSLTNEIFMFGGRSSAERTCFDDFWSYNLNHNLANLSMKDCSWLLINGYIVEEIYYKQQNYNVDYPLELNDIILNFLGIFNTIHIWQKLDKLILPRAIYQFGYVLYMNRVIITFGGRDETNECIDNIFYLDLLNKNDGWKECKLKCPKPSTYNAVLMNNNTVHIIPFYVHKDHYSIPIKKLLPNKLIDQISLDIYCDESVNKEFQIEYKQILNLRYKYFLNKIILSILIGAIITVIGLILYFVAQPNIAATIIISIGIIIIICSR
eukprot:176981_1